MPPSYYIWHCRLGHANENIVRTTLGKFNISNVNKSILDFCIARCFGKSHSVPSQSLTSMYSKPFELSFLDL